MLQPGHVFTIEPMLNLGQAKDVLWPDQWTAVSMLYIHTYTLTYYSIYLPTHILYVYIITAYTFSYLTNHFYAYAHLCLHYIYR